MDSLKNLNELFYMEFIDKVEYDRRVSELLPKGNEYQDSETEVEENKPLQEEQYEYKTKSFCLCCGKQVQKYEKFCNGTCRKTYKTCSICGPCTYTRNVRGKRICLFCAKCTKCGHQLVGTDWQWYYNRLPYCGKCKN